MGPILLIDKSAVQALSADELRVLEWHFTVMLAPALVMEVLADLKKAARDEEAPEGEVRVLAKKLAGLGKVSVEHWVVCQHSLLGKPTPQHRQIRLRAKRSHHVDGTTVDFISESPAEEAVRRWAGGEFTEDDQALAEWWRDIESRIDLEDYASQLDRYYVILPEVSDLSSAAAEADRLLGDSSLQEVWIRWLIDDLPGPPNLHDLVLERWRGSPVASLETFAPYAHKCARTQLIFLLSLRSSVIGSRSTNLFDLQYCFYLPFAMAFSSRDKLHARLAGVLLEDGQDFVDGDALKADLRERSREWESLSDREKAMRRYALSSYPTPMEGSVVSDLWENHMISWTPDSVNRAARLPDDMSDEAVRIAQESFERRGSVD